MKVIQHGNAYNETICPNCKCQIGYTKNEIKTKLVNMPFDERYFGYQRFIECPECKQLIIVDN